MRGNSFGKLLSMTSFGESHGKGLGVIIDGVPSGLDFNLEDLKAQLKKRAPGQLPGTTSRKEQDNPIIYSGIYEGKTLGTPIMVLVENTNQRSDDYKKLKNEFRPGHADETTLLKYGIRDHRGGGRSSGRETLARVIGGYFASLILPETKINSWITQLGPFEMKTVNPSANAYHLAEAEREKEIESFLLGLKEKGDSVGGRVETIIENCPVGLGEPVFDKLKADMAKAILSIGACVGFGIGLGEDMANQAGSIVSQNRESFGGIEGGISNGRDIKMTSTFKPTSTVGEKAKEGRHDPCILPRVIPVVNSMAMFVLADHYLRQKAYQ
ncbi:MAG: chorismate synthase [Bdellovibrionales bacterium]|nr:chorismate synthase [Bdellovibrionales bacterium]